MLALTLLLCYVAFSSLRLERTWQALRTSDYLWLAPALLVLAIALVIRAMRWRVLFAPARRPPLGPVAHAMMLGYLYNSILPARPGEVARVLALSRSSDAQPAEILATAVLERLYDVLGVLVIFFLALPWLPHVSWLTPAAIAAAVLAAAIVSGAVLLAFFGESPLRLLLAPLRRVPGLSRERLERIAADLAHGLSGLRHRGVAISGFCLTLLAWMLTAALAYLVSLAFHLHLPFACAVLVTVAIGLAMIVPAPPAAVGVFEGAALIGLKVYGISYSVALPYALVLHLVNFLPFILVGVPLLHYDARSRARGRERQRAPLALTSTGAP